MINLHSCFVFKTHFHGSLPNLLHALTFVPSSLMYIQLPHNTYMIGVNHTNFIQFMIYEIKEMNWEK